MFQRRLVHLTGVCRCLKKTFSLIANRMSCLSCTDQTFLRIAVKISYWNISRLKEPPPFLFKKKRMRANYHQRNQSLFSTTAFQVLPTTDSLSVLPLCCCLATPLPFDLLPMALISLITVCYSSNLSSIKSLFHLVCSTKFMNAWLLPLLNN